MNPVTLLSIVAILGVIGCKHLDDSQPSGSVSSRAVRPYNSPVVPIDAEKLKITIATDVFQDAKLLEPHEEPKLPEGWETQLAYPWRINIRASIDQKGDVTYIERSPVDLAPAAELFAECYSAIQKAVMNWKFAPAVRARVKPGLDGRPVITSQQEIGTILYFEFRLTSNRMIELELKNGGKRGYSENREQLR
jgi:hypothetical protein